MLKRFFVFFIIILSSKTTLAQCHNPQFQFLQNPSCGLVQIQNQTSGSIKQEWDFSTGDLQNNPNRVPGYYLLDARGLNIVKDENTGNYHGFTLLGTAGLVRLDFGNSLMNTPTETVLGTFSLISASSFSNFAVAYDGTNWWGYLGNATNRVLSFNFGTSITNIPTVTNSAILTGVTNSRNVDLAYFQGNWYLIIANNNNQIAIYQIGSSLSSTLTYVRNYSLNLATAGITGLKTLTDCDTLRIFGCYGPAASASVFKVDFPVDFSSPVEASMALGAGGTPQNFDFAYDGDRWWGFAHLSSAYRRFFYADKAFNGPQNITNMPALTGMTDIRGMKLIKENSTWHLFFVDRTVDSLVHLIFPEPNSASISSSSLFNPLPYTYATQGTKIVDLMSYNNPYNFRFYSDSVTILPKPLANFTFNGACLGKTVQFTSTSTVGGGASITQYEWDFGDGNNSSLQNPTHTYTSSGTYSVQLIVTTNQNCKDTVIQNVFYSPGPTSNFTFNIGCQNATTTFNNTSTAPGNDPIVSYFWDFGDGNNSTQENPTHVYTSSGNFDVKLKVTTQNGCQDSITQNIFIPTSPVPNFSFSQVCLGSATNFTDLSTGNIASVFWDMGDGNTFNSPISSYTFANPGTYNVKLRVTGTNGCPDSIIKQVKIVEITSLSIQAVSDTCQYASINFQGNATSVGDAIYEWIWDFGNGDSAFVQNPTYTYNQTGNFNVKLTVRAGLDCYQTTSLNIQINPAPQANFSASTVCFGNTTQFTDNTSYPPGQSEVYRMWYFGNGDSSNALNPTYTYASPGIYNVKLVVESNTGCRNQMIKPVMVAPVPTAGVQTSGGCINELTYFRDNSSILNIDSITTWNWDIQGYGTFTSKDVTIVPITTDSIPYQLTVTSSNGCSATYQDTLWIDGVNFQVSPNPVCAFSNITLQNNSKNTTNYQWDFCLGDLQYTPKRTLDFPLLDARSINFVQDPITQNWYAFVINPDGLVRLDFGNSLENTPTYNVLGTFGITTSMFSRVIVKYDGTKWFGYMGNASTRLITFDFGTNITNIPTANTTAVLTGVNGSRNVEVFQYNGIWYIIVVNSNANVAVFSAGSNLSSTLTHLQTYTSSNSSAQFTDLKALVKCGSVEVVLNNSNGGTSSINKLTFSQMNQSPIETIFPNNVNTGFLHIVLGYDNKKWNSFIFTQNSTFRRVVFNEFLSSVDTNYIVTNPNLKDIRGAELVKQNSTWYLFLVDRTADSLVRFTFPDTCFANIAYSNAFEPTGLQYSRNGTFNIQLNGLNNNNFTWSTQTRSIQITPAPTIQVQISNLCEKSPVTFNNQTTYIDTSATVNYFWDFGDGNTSTQKSPVHYYDTTGTYTVYLTASVQGLCSSQDSFVITIHPRPIADFQFSTSCANSPVLFTNLSTINNDVISFYKWEFGDGTFSLDPNPAHQYLIGGTYQVNCIVISSNGCVDTASQTIQVPKVNFIYQNTCFGQTVDFISDLFYPNDNPQTYQWFINNQPVSNQPNFSHFFTNIGTYQVKLVIQTQNGCNDSTIKNVDIIQQPIANFQVVGSTCLNDTVLFIENSSLSNRPIALRIWDFGDGTVDTTTQKNIYHAFTAPGNYNVTLTIVTTTNCTASISLPVIVGTTPTVGFIQQNLYCNQKTFTLIDTSSSSALDTIVSRYWNLGNGMFSTNPILEYQYPDTGTHIISLTVTTQSGCSATVYDTLYFYQQPRANFVFTQDTFLTVQNVTINNLSQNAHHYLWLRSDSATWISTDTVPNLKFEVPGTYTVTLIAMHDSGCVDTVQKSVIVVLPVDTIMDIAVLDLQTLLDSADILTVSVKIKNKSTVPVYKATMFVRLGQEIANREFYLGNLAPGAIEEYIFKANILTNPYEKLTYICVSGILPNDLQDVYPEDNDICKSLNDDFYIQNPYPNPASQSLTIPYILPANDIVRIQIINEIGQIVTTLKDDFGEKGLNIIQADISKLSAGTYAIVFEFQGKFLVKKFVKY